MRGQVSATRQSSWHCALLCGFCLSVSSDVDVDNKRKLLFRIYRKELLGRAGGCLASLRYKHVMFFKH